MPIVTNLTKAKTIAHDMRRAKRAEEFEPHDEVISKQIPGADATAADAIAAWDSASGRFNLSGYWC